MKRSRTSHMAALAAALTASFLATTGPVRADQDAWSEMFSEMMEHGMYALGRGGVYPMGPLLDTDNDGIVSPSEAAEHSVAAFTLLDADHDDAISQDEYMDLTTGMPMASGMPMMTGWRGAERLYRNRTARFTALDADGDGSVTRAEFMTQAEASFAKADANGDGKVTIWEYRSERQPF